MKAIRNAILCGLLGATVLAGPCALSTYVDAAAGTDTSACDGHWLDVCLPLAWDNRDLIGGGE